MALSLIQVRRFALAASVLTAACDAAGPDGREVRRSRVQIDLRQIYQGGRITVIDTVTLAIRPANGAEQHLRSLVSSPDAPVTFDVTVETGTVAFEANVLSNNGASLYTARREVDIQEDGFTVALDLVGIRPVLAVSPDSIMLSESDRTFTVENLGVESLSWSAQPPANVGLEPAEGSVGVGESQVVTVFGSVGAPPVGGSVLVRVVSPEGSLDVKVQGSAPVFAVAVTPDGGSSVASEFGSGSETFVVQNAGNTPDTYTITCAGEGDVVCTEPGPTTVELTAGEVFQVTAVYDVGPSGVGTLVLTAESPQATDQGSYTVSCCEPSLRRAK
jgi:hypothetical protein